MQVIILLHRQRLVVYPVGGDQSVETFLDTDNDVERFKLYLQRYPHACYIVVLDLEEEQFHLQKVPKVGRRDRKSILQHHQRKYFDDGPFASAVVVDRKRKVEAQIDVTLIGLSLDAPDSVWLTMLEEEQVRVRSFHWMSLLLYPLVQAIGVVGSLTIALVRVDTDDDRVMAFLDRQPLVCRRLTTRNSGMQEDGGDGSSLAEQVMQTFTYLERLTESVKLQLPPVDSVATLAMGGFTTLELESVNRQLLAAGVKPLVHMTLAAMADATDHRMNTTETVAELMARSVVVRKPYSYSLVFRGVNFLQRRIRHAVYAVSISLFAGAALASVASRYVAADLARLESFATQVESAALQVKQVHPYPDWVADYSIDGIRESVGRIESIEFVNQSTPFHFLVSLSAQLTSHSGIELQSVHWTGVESELIEQAANNGKYAEDVAFSASDQNPSATATQSPGFSAIIIGSVRLAERGSTEAMQEFRSFVGSVRASASETSPGTVVTVVTLPFGGTNPVSHPTAGSFVLEVNLAEFMR